MKTDNCNENDAPLRALLKEWKPESSLPPRFQEQVWRCVERVEAASVPSVSLANVFANWLTNLLPRPALAATYVMALLAIGAGVGWNLAQQKMARVTSDLGIRYAQMVDPYQPLGRP